MVISLRNVWHLSHGQSWAKDAVLDGMHYDDHYHVLDWSFN